MRVSLSWLKDYIPIDTEPEVIAEKLTMAGLEVESVEKRYHYLDRVVVAKVESVRPHPNADKLSVCRVDAGTGQLLQIVCGAPNVREGMFAPCALEGAVLPGEFKIKAGKIRGEISQGMLCSAAELRLDADASGIMDMKGDFGPGIPLERALNLNDALFEIDLTPNRPDCLCVIGIAREIGAFEKPRRNVRFPDITLPENRMGDNDIHAYARVDILDPDLCPRYSAGLMTNVKIKPSPFWLREKLESVGLSSINNVVDITNFVMMETGQPLHAFDFDQVAQGRIVVRRAGTDRDFKTLDGKTHCLEPDMLMICDGARPVALAGVMGGENSEITDATTRVLIESAYFNPVSIRKTAKITGIATDASHRFERGADPEGTMNALKRAMSLMADLCDASIVHGRIDVYPGKTEAADMNLSLPSLNTRLGTDFDMETVQAILESVEFKTVRLDETILKVQIPSFRVDVTRPEDLSEEVARLWGYDHIQTTYPLVPAQGRPLSPKIPLRQKIRQILNGFSLSEAINYNFINENSCDRLNLAEDDNRRRAETILNPISDQMSVLRTSMLPGLLDTMRKNISQQTTNVRLFEIGKVFHAVKKGELPEEHERVAGLLTGNRFEQCWYAKKTEMDFYDLKGVIEGLLEALLIRKISFERADSQACPYYQKGYAAVALSKDRILGNFGKIDAGALKNFGLKQDAFVFDFSLSSIQDMVPATVAAGPLPKFPSISRDLTIILDARVAAGDVLTHLNQAASQEALVESLFLFDVFQGDPLPAGKKSLSFRVVYRSTEKTLKEKNIHKLHESISKTLLSRFNAALPESA